MTVSRKTFCGGLAAGSVLLWLQACGGGGDGGTTTAGLPTGVAGDISAGAGGGAGGGGGGSTIPPPLDSCGALGNRIENNHGHVLAIPFADLVSNGPRTYSIASTAGHDHTVTFSAGQLAELLAKRPVVVRSSTAEGHDHLVTAQC